MKKCPKCGEVYKNYYDTCNRCNIDLDTGENVIVRSKTNVKQCIPQAPKQKRVKWCGRISIFFILLTFFNIRAYDMTNVYISVLTFMSITALASFLYYYFSLYGKLKAIACRISKIYAVLYLIISCSVLALTIISQFLGVVHSEPSYYYESSYTIAILGIAFSLCMKYYLDNTKGH